jgi:hypothetical protein
MEFVQCSIKFTYEWRICGPIDMICALDGDIAERGHSLYVFTAGLTNLPKVLNKIFLARKIKTSGSVTVFEAYELQQ